MKYRIWSKKDKDYATETYNLAVGEDGKVYEFEAAAMGGDTWLERTDVSDQFEAHWIKEAGE